MIEPFDLEIEKASPIGLLAAQMGTPEAPTSKALRSYLREFLSDPRVVDRHPLKWLPILYLFILPRRPVRSAALYRRIWTAEGSPLMVHSQAQVDGLRQLLGGCYRVALGMRYGRPSIESAIRTLIGEGCRRIVALPMFPQFSSSTTGSIYDAVIRAANGRRCPLFFERRRFMPTLRFVPPYYAHPAYIEALKTTIEETAARAGRQPERYLFTFHGLPRRYVDEGDPYYAHCQVTSQLLAGALRLPEEQWALSFQSRFGREVWLQPYTDELLERLGKKGGSLLVSCPGFAADCLETLDEMGRVGAGRFRAAGGAEFWLTPCLNAHPRWLEALAAIVRQESAGWVE